ncbi:MAG: hypothetical protein ABIG89_02805 [Candidatus Woesearchaeota archaeon]
MTDDYELEFGMRAKSLLERIKAARSTKPKHVSFGSDAVYDSHNSIASDVDTSASDVDTFASDVDTSASDHGTSTSDVNRSTDNTTRVDIKPISLPTQDDITRVDIRPTLGDETYADVSSPAVPRDVSFPAVPRKVSDRMSAPKKLDLIDPRKSGVYDSAYSQVNGVTAKAGSVVDDASMADDISVADEASKAYDTSVAGRASVAGDETAGLEQFVDKEDLSSPQSTIGADANGKLAYEVLSTDKISSVAGSDKTSYGSHHEAKGGEQDDSSDLAIFTPEEMKHEKKSLEKQIVDLTKLNQQLTDQLSDKKRNGRSVKYAVTQLISGKEEPALKREVAYALFYLLGERGYGNKSKINSRPGLDYATSIRDVIDDMYRVKNRRFNSLRSRLGSDITCSQLSRVEKFIDREISRLTSQESVKSRKKERKFNKGCDSIGTHDDYHSDYYKTIILGGLGDNSKGSELLPYALLLDGIYELIRDNRLIPDGMMVNDKPEPEGKDTATEDKDIATEDKDIATGDKDVATRDKDSSDREKYIRNGQNKSKPCVSDKINPIDVYFPGNVDSTKNNQGKKEDSSNNADPVISYRPRYLTDLLDLRSNIPNEIVAIVDRYFPLSVKQDGTDVVNADMSKGLDDGQSDGQSGFFPEGEGNVDAASSKLTHPMSNLNDIIDNKSSRTGSVNVKAWYCGLLGFVSLAFTGILALSHNHITDDLADLFIGDRISHQDGVYEIDKAGNPDESKTTEADRSKFISSPSVKSKYQNGTKGEYGKDKADRAVTKDETPILSKVMKILTPASSRLADHEGEKSGNSSSADSFKFSNGNTAKQDNQSKPANQIKPVESPSVVSVHDAGKAGSDEKVRDTSNQKEEQPKLESIVKSEPDKQRSIESHPAFKNLTDYLGSLGFADYESTNKNYRLFYKNVVITGNSKDSSNVPDFINIHYDNANLDIDGKITWNTECEFGKSVANPAKCRVKTKQYYTLEFIDDKSGNKFVVVKGGLYKLTLNAESDGKYLMAESDGEYRGSWITGCVEDNCDEPILVFKKPVCRSKHFVEGKQKCVNFTKILDPDFETYLNPNSHPFLGSQVSVVLDEDGEIMIMDIKDGKRNDRYTRGVSTEENKPHDLYVKVFGEQLMGGLKIAHSLINILEGGNNVR